MAHLFKDAALYHGIGMVSKISKSTALKIGIVVFAILTAINWALAFAAAPAWQHMFFSACFGPLGGCLRWELGLRNKHAKDFKLFTFIPNVFAAGLTVVLGAVWSGSALASALSTGFSGSLSTVSTLVLETYQLSMRSQRAAWVYAFGTFFCAQIVCLILQVIC